GRTAIVTTMKNEGPFILEWIAYHRMIGVDDFLIYTNDCSDGTDTMLDLLQAKGLVQHRDNPFKETGLKPQHAALQAAEAEPVMQNCGWGICMDVDEFINIKIGDGTLRALYDAMGEANMISLTWRLFGNAEVHEYQDRFLLEQFDRCAPEVIRKPHQAWGFKTLFRNIDIYKKLGVHRPKGLKPDLWDEVRWLNGSGKPLPKEMYRNGWRSTLETYGYDWVSLNHYAVRSAESFLVKRDRGRVNHVDRDQGLNYWFRMNHNIDQDTSIQRMIPALRLEFERLLADPEIRAAHAHSVGCHRAKIAELRATENYTQFYGELTGARMEALCRLQQHFGSAVFAAGPGVIPEGMHEGVKAKDFFFTVEHNGEAEH
ncbi:MAG: glycosyltransferase family 2 protein, partial [Paracoccaceae bacterium]